MHHSSPCGASVGQLFRFAPKLPHIASLNVHMNIQQLVRKLREEGYIEGELSVDPLWYIIWEPENIDEYNRDYEVAQYAPGFTAFGSNGGNELLVINSGGEVFTLPAIGMEPQYADKVAESIDDLKQYMELNI